MTNNEVNLKERLEAFLDQIVDHNIGARHRQEEREAGDKAFLESFQSLRESSIGPVMEKACRPFKDRALPASVRTTDNANASSISLILAPEAQRHAHLIYTTALVERTVRARWSVSHRNKGEVQLSAGDTPLGEFPLEEVTGDLVQEHIDSLLSKMIE